MDAEESFALRLTSINNYQQQIDEILTKYYSAKLTVQPFLLVEGLSDVDIKGFYVYFDKTLYKFDSYIESLDLCFKIFQVSNLKYPDACQLPWLFIQNFFFGINTSFDIKSANITCLLNFLSNN